MDFSLLGLWSQMGTIARLVVIILLGMSMYSIGVAIDRFLAFTKGKKRSLEYIGALQPLLESRGKIQQAGRHR